MWRDGRIVKPCALAFQGVEQLAMVGVVHHADNRFAVGKDGQRVALLIVFERQLSAGFRQLAG